jgi:integrase
MTLDIHNYAGQHVSALARLDRGDLTPRNKALVRGYVQTCTLRGICGHVRLTRCIVALTTLLRRLGKDIDTASKEELQALVAGLHDGSFKPLTVSTYKKILKRFLLFVHCPDFPNVTTTPPLFAWLNGTVRKRERPMLRRADLLTDHDVEQLIRHAGNERDRAFISHLWETGARVSESGNLRIKDVHPATHGYTTDLTGKTGTRSPLVVSSAPYLATWLAHHPCKDNPEAPLWVRRDCDRLLGYRSIADMLKRAFARAGITKPANPHTFRHSRVTHVLARGLMNEAQACVYFGWTMGTKIFSTYAHLIDTDANNAILREHHLAPSAPATPALTPKTCTRCGALNTSGVDHCTACHTLIPERGSPRDDLTVLLIEQLLRGGDREEILARIARPPP